MSPGNKRPLVGIGMPVYNGSRYLRAALESIRAQTLTDWELVICDNASEDDTESICREFAERDQRIRYLRNDWNLGAHPNYNKSFALSQGVFFKWAPHDDILQPEYLSRCVRTLEHDTGLVLCQSLIDYIDEHDRSLGIYDSRLTGSIDTSPTKRFASLILRPHPCYEVMGVYRRSAVQGSMLLESFHGADRALLAEMALRGRFGQVREPLLRVRDHKERYTRKQKNPIKRARWHDTAFKGRFSFPTWRLYGEYFRMLKRNPLPFGQRLRCVLTLMEWWGRDWNWARMAVDVLAGVWPGLLHSAENFKQKYFDPEPGAGEVRHR